MSNLLGFGSPAALNSAPFFFELQYGFFARISDLHALPRKGNVAIMKKSNCECTKACLRSVVSLPQM